jgi:transcriptional regulator with XRE-family HTH domain
LNTIGDHLRKTRLDRGLSQSDVARVLNVTTDTETNWELNRCKPTAKLAKSIIDFLGYFPFPVDNLSLGKQFYYARLITGKTQKQVAAQIGCDASNLRYIELGKRKPRMRVRAKIQGFINAALAMT